MPPPKPHLSSKTFAVKDYHLARTLDCGQAFRWTPYGEAWIGVIGDHWIQARQSKGAITIETTHPCPDWQAIEDYFQISVDIKKVIRQFPKDEHLGTATKQYTGLRLLKQPHWECLASFILSSTKQIVHIRQIIKKLTEVYGTQTISQPGFPNLATFPSAETVSGIGERRLRELGMGYRANYLSATARQIAQAPRTLTKIEDLPYIEAKQALEGFPGVGPKIADCVLLFAYGKQEAFPIDVWVRRALTDLYFPGQSPTNTQLNAFAASYFHPFNGYAQQYLFHYMRTRHPTKIKTPS